MIKIVIGQAGSGKTTYVKDNFMGTSNKYLFTVPVKYTLCNSHLLFGDYVTDKRCQGTDTLAYDALPKIIEFLRILTKANYPFDIILEGDRINNARFFEEVSKLGVPVQVIVMACSLQTSIARLQKEGSKITAKFIKATITKTANNKELCKQLNLPIIEINN